MNLVPKRCFFTRGVGRHKEKLQSFELALRNAGIEKCNLVTVSSIFPPKCRLIPREKGLKELHAGQVTFCVMSRAESNEPNRLLSASVGLAVPAEHNTYGYLSEHHSFGWNERKAGDYAEDLAVSMLASTLKIDFDPNKSWDERKKIYKMSGKIVKTTSIAQSSLGDKNGLWTTVIAVAVFLF